MLIIVIQYLSHTLLKTEVIREKGTFSIDEVFDTEQQQGKTTGRSGRKKSEKKTNNNRMIT